MKTLNLVVATQGHPRWHLAHNRRIPGEIPVTLELGLPSPARYSCRLAPQRNLLRAGALGAEPGAQGDPWAPRGPVRWPQLCPQRHSVPPWVGVLSSHRAFLCPLTASCPGPGSAGLGVSGSKSSKPCHKLWGVTHLDSPNTTGGTDPRWWAEWELGQPAPGQAQPPTAPPRAHRQMAPQTGAPGVEMQGPGPLPSPAGPGIGKAALAAETCEPDTLTLCHSAQRLGPDVSLHCTAAHQTQCLALPGQPSTSPDTLPSFAGTQNL